MAQIIITPDLKKKIFRTFKAESVSVFQLLESLTNNPRKGKALTHVAEIVIKEVKYGKYRFYCITDGQTLKFGTEEELTNLIIKFVRMSDKKDQQRIINELKVVLQAWGLEKLKQ